MTDKKYYEMINRFSRTEEVDVVAKEYPKVFTAICKKWFHLPNRVIKDIFENMCQGNWKHLWPTEEEAKQGKQEWAYALCNDIFYCSDRMSWDRLIRIHWTYQRFTEAQLEQKEGNKVE